MENLKKNSQPCSVSGRLFFAENYLFREIFYQLLFFWQNFGIKMNNKTNGKKSIPLKDHENISQQMKIGGKTIHFVDNTTFTRVKSMGQKNVADVKSARPVDHGDERGPKVSTVKTAYLGSAPTNARTTAPKGVPKKQPTLAPTKVLFILL